MKLDNITFQRIRDIPILDVADKLQLKYSSKGSWRKTLCFCHDDHTPSMGLNPSRNQWKCFSCGKGGSHIDLVMEYENLSFNDACEWLIREFNIPVPQLETRKSLIEAIKSKLMNYNNDNVNDNCSSVSKFLSSELLTTFKGVSNEFTRALVNSKILTPEQMQHAAEVFRLSTANDNVIFWQIDRDNHIREGKVMYYQADAHRSHTRKPVTISWLLKQEKQLPDDWKAKYCLFGLHQLADAKVYGLEFMVNGNHPDGNSINHKPSSINPQDCIIAVVESEKTAIICSELIPSLDWHSSINHKPDSINLPVIWLATGGSSNLTVQSLQPIKGRKVIIFPDTDPQGITYQEWLTIAKEASKQFGHPITVSNLLELHATEDQKKRKIDIADFIIESKTSNV